MPNEQTSVPLFASGEVLTASNLNLSAGTGVPVFLNTTTRDAAFGGASEKVLAEGQLCYLSSTNVVQYYDGAAWATVGPTTSKIAQVVQTVVATAVSTASTSYVTSSLNAAITPTLNTSKVLIIVSMPFSNDSYPTSNFTIFRGTVAGTNLAGATGFGQFKTGASTNPSFQLVFNATYLDSPATTSATTYTVGMKTDGGTVVSFPSSTTGSITLIEVLA
jgi:hypothetical protein